MPRRPLPVAAAAVLLLAGPALAHAGRGPRLDLDLDLGHALPERVDPGGATDLPALRGLVPDRDVGPDDAPVPDGGHGLALAPGGGRLRLGADLSRRVGDVDGPGADSGGGRGEVGALVGLANAYYDLGLPLRPYVGGGVGAARLSVDAGAGGPMDVDDEGWALAWGLAAGLGYELAEGLELTGGYRYLWIEGTNLEADGGGELEVGEYASHEVLLRLCYAF